MRMVWLTRAIPYNIIQAVGAPYGYPQNLQGTPGIGQQNPWQQMQGLNPLSIGLHNPLLHNPLAQAYQQNPLIHPLVQALQQNPLLAYQQMLAQQMWQQQQQPQTPFPYPLAPQALGGQGIGQFGTGIGQPYGQQQLFGQLNPLAQAAFGRSRATSVVRR